MIISHEHKFIFIHNPKCAGTSVRAALSKYDSEPESFWCKIDKRLPRADMAHMEISYIKNYYPEIWRMMQSYFVFGFVRDPMDRLVSGFNETHKPLYAGLMRNDISLENYRDVLSAYCSKMLKFPADKCPYVHVVPQHRMYYDDSKLMADMIIRTEDFSANSVAKLRLFVGNNICEDLVRIACGQIRKNSKPMQFAVEDLLDDGLIDELKGYYEKDFLLFDYKT